MLVPLDCNRLQPVRMLWLSTTQGQPERHLQRVVVVARPFGSAFRGFERGPSIRGRFCRAVLLPVFQPGPRRRFRGSFGGVVLLPVLQPGLRRSAADLFETGPFGALMCALEGPRCASFDTLAVVLSNLLGHGDSNAPALHCHEPMRNARARLAIDSL